jgi:hypothetical protein
MKASHLLLVAFGLLPTMIQAQGPTSGTQFPQPSQSPPFSQRHASTAFEGELRGKADVIRAMGEFNYNTATSALIFEEARKANYANELRHAETFWAKRNLHASQTATPKIQRPVPATKPEVAPVAHAAQAGFRTPATFIAPGHPHFVWPTGLNHPAFDSFRNKLAQHFSQRTLINSGSGSASFFRIQGTTGEMRLVLSSLIRELPPMAYLEARQFLDQADYQASLRIEDKVATLK